MQHWDGWPPPHDPLTDCFHWNNTITSRTQRLSHWIFTLFQDPLYYMLRFICIFYNCMCMHLRIYISVLCLCCDGHDMGSERNAAVKHANFSDLQLKFWTKVYFSFITTTTMYQRVVWPKLNCLGNVQASNEWRNWKGFGNRMKSASPVTRTNLSGVQEWIFSPL